MRTYEVKSYEVKSYEVNFDGIVGPTHNYSGLSFGNVASLKHQKMISNPKKAALQGLDKMWSLAKLGCKQAVLPPQERPDIATLKKLGFSGSESEILSHVAKHAPELLNACSSASSMWAANAATVSPSADSQDGKVHITPANLCNKLHRSIEPPTTHAVLAKIFHDPRYFVVHPPLPGSQATADEGAANHNRFCKHYGEPGIQLFVFGRYGLPKGEQLATTRFPARHTIEASQAIARLHQLHPERTLFVQQNPRAIDAGVFHNDVIAVANQQVWLYHELAFVEPKQLLTDLQKMMTRYCHTPLIPIQVKQKQVSLEEAVTSYLFNSQLVTVADGSMVLLAPTECKQIPSVKACIERIVQDRHNPIQQVHYYNLRESMCNGGGPACLRLRVVLTEQELAAIHQPILLTETLYAQLTDWVKRHYRDRLSPKELSDPQLLIESRQALDELTQLLKLKSVYPFQFER